MKALFEFSFGRSLIHYINLFLFLMFLKKNNRFLLNIFVIVGWEKDLIMYYSIKV
jgi:hypothetical protein